MYAEEICSCCIHVVNELYLTWRLGVVGFDKTEWGLLLEQLLSSISPFTALIRW